jgi:hypothetical protein
MQTLSKSDFQLASSCSKKLVYKKAEYPTSNDTNEYMEMLAQGGYIVGHMATLLFPEGVEITGSTSESVAKTKEYLEQENCTLFEAAIQAGQKIIRIDVLKKRGNKLHLIEVKAKSHNTEEEAAKKDKEFEKYIEDVAYQYMVLTEAYPEYEVECSLLMPDKAKRTQIDGLAGWFSIKPGNDSNKELEEIITQQKPRFNKPEVVFKYENDLERNKYVNQLLQEGILDYKYVTEKVIQLQPEIKKRAVQFLEILNEGINSSHFQIGNKCKGCEFNSGDNLTNGYKECWGELAIEKDYIFDLYYGAGKYFDELIEQQKTSLWDIDVERLKNKKGEFGPRGTRQMIQLENTRNNREWISNELKSISGVLKYPLHFIDFETYTGAMPFHKGMRPYELIAFQWSCHTINHPGAEPVHNEWIHTGINFPNGEDFPNFEFAVSLMNLIGNTGTPFMWATHENTVLRGILNQMEIFKYENETLRQWLINITKDKDRDGRLVDMNRMTQDHYFHPYMKGRTSIKKVLPAIWNHNPYLHDILFFKDYAATDLQGRVIDPYDTLVAISEEDAEDDVVNGGTDAMRAYQRIRFDDSLTTAQKEEIKNQLLNYCKLDTMAMVIIAHHWGIR